MSAPTIREQFGMDPVKGFNVKFYSTLPPLEEMIKSDRLVGIEVEVENVSFANNFQTEVWQQVGDGSLRNQGSEFITRPIAASIAPHALHELLQHVFSKTCCFSPRTSVHVHVNCQDLTDAQVSDITLMYACLEPFFYQFAGRGRARNIYCVPLYDTQLMQNVATSQLGRYLNNWSKYTGFNIVPLSEKGTVEFRQMHGTFDYKKLTIWIRLITKLFDYVIAQGTTTIRKLVSGWNPTTDLFGILVSIFGDDVRVFKKVEYATIKNAVENARLAFVDPVQQNELLRTRDLKSAYFTGKGA